MSDIKSKIHTRNENIDGISEWHWFREENGAWDSRKHWPQQKEKILEYCKKFDVAVQAGGNQGMYPRLMANIFKTVYTFEPHWENFHVLNLNCCQDNIVKIQGALGDKHCMVNLSNGSYGNMGTFVTKEDENEIVPQFMIDDLNLQTLDLIYLDIEGYEGFALRGAEQSIMKFKPIIVCESGDKVKDLLDSYGYEGVFNSHSDRFFAPKK